MTASTSQSTFEHAIGPQGVVHVRLMSGAVTVRAVDGDVVRVRERNGKSLTEAFRIEAGEGRLALTTDEKVGSLDFLVFSFGRRSSFDLDIEVPTAARATIESASADISVTGTTGPLKLRSASGDMTLHGIGGDVELDSVSGDVEVDHAGSIGFRARTISGDLSLRAARLGRAAIESTSGDIRIDALLDGKGPFEIQTVSGDVTIVGRSGIRVEARTVTGDLRSELPHRRESGSGRKVLIVGDGGTALGFRSVSGDLRVTEPRDPGSVATAASAGLPSDPPAPPRAPDGPSVDAMAPASVPPNPEAAREAGHEVARLDILRALERGEMSVEAAMARIASIEEA